MFHIDSLTSVVYIAMVRVCTVVGFHILVIFDHIIASLS